MVFDVPCGMTFSGGIIITSPLDKHGFHGLAESLTAQGAAAADLRTQQRRQIERTSSC